MPSTITNHNVFVLYKKDGKDINAFLKCLLCITTMISFDYFHFKGILCRISKLLSVNMSFKVDPSSQSSTIVREREQ